MRPLLIGETFLELVQIIDSEYCRAPAKEYQLLYKRVITVIRKLIMSLVTLFRTSAIFCQLIKATTRFLIVFRYWEKEMSVSQTNHTHIIRLVRTLWVERQMVYDNYNIKGITFAHKFWKFCSNSQILVPEKIIAKLLIRKIPEILFS